MIGKLFKKLIFVLCFFTIASCTTTVPKPGIQKNMAYKKVIKLNVAQVKVVGMTYLNTYCESGIKYCPRDVLIKWLNDRIIVKSQKGLLLVNINNAVLQRIETKDCTDKYQGVYDVTLRLFKDQQIPNDYVEFNVVTKNYRLIPRNKNSKEKTDIIIEQVNELIRLLENEIIVKSNIYFGDYLIG